MNCHRSRGFALPTVIIASIIMLTVLVASIVSMSSVRNSLLGQYYNQLSQEAADAGLKYAQSCLDANGGIPQWNDTYPLVPGTSCSGLQLAGYTCPETSTDWRCSVMINGNIKTSFRVGLPSLNSDGKAVDLSSLGIVNLIKTSDGSTWRTYSQSSKTKIIATSIVADNIVLNLDAGNIKSYSGSGTAWTDLSGNNNNGVLMNGVSFSNADGGSLIFDGTDDYVNLGTNVSLNTGDNVTIGAWVKPSVLSGRYAIYSNRNSNQTSSSQLEIGSVDGNVNTAYFTTPGLFTAKASNNAMTIDNWQYVVYTRIGSLQSIYINGVNATKSVIDTTFSDNNSHKTIGVGSLTSPCYFKGQISAVQVYSRSLSSEEIKQNYKAMVGRYNRYNLRSIQTLIVGGGGGGASSSYNVGGGGGGGGGYVYSENLIIPAGSYGVVVGNGSPPNANTASASSFADLIAAAGASGGGAPYNLGIGLSGAVSGGGSASATTAAGSDLSGQYHNGGLGFGTYGVTITSGGGGGGAGGAGGAASNSSAGAGGAGVTSYISGTGVIYASGGAGGIGIGGIAGASGAANTGRGGRGGGGNLAGGAGGSGVVIIRYLTGLYSATGGTITTSGDYTIHTFTSSGTFKIN